MANFKREYRYTVFKHTDAVRALSDEELNTLTNLSAKVSAVRRKTGRLPFNCVIVEHDWPEYESTWDAIKKRVESEDE